MPLTFTNVKHYSGYSLEQFVQEEWVKVDQSVTEMITGRLGMIRIAAHMN